MSKSKPIYRAILSIFHLSDDLAGAFYLSKDVMNIINMKVLTNDDLAIDEASIKKALKGDGQVYSNKMRDLNIGYAGDDTIFVYHSHQLIHNGPRSCAVGRFVSDKAAREVDKEAIATSRHSLRNITIKIDSDVKAELIDFVKKKKHAKQKKKGTPTGTSGTTSSKKTQPKKAQSSKSTAAVGKRKAGDSSTTVQSQPSPDTTVSAQHLSAADALLLGASLPPATAADALLSGVSLPPATAADALLSGVSLPPAATAKKQRTVPPAQDVRT